jgi:HD-GYP domain-containing protein (c-di-GMP phosphodiesterase class II)
MTDGSHRYPYDVITSDRPYRKARPVHYALEEIRRNAGSQFDPQVVEAFLRVGTKGFIRHENTMREHAVPLPYAAM